jgi:hypothetical protein
MGCVFSKEGAMERIHTSDVISAEIRKGFGAAAVLLAAIPNSVIAAPKKPTSEKTERTTSVGVLACDPYFVGVVGEQELHPSLAVQLHGGTNLDDFCGGGRLLLKHPGVWEPYVGIGGGFETRFGETHPIGVGSAGLRVGRDRARMFVEINRSVRETYWSDELQWSTGGAAGLLVELGDENEPREFSRMAEPDSSPVPSAKKSGSLDKPTWGLAVGVPYTIAVTYEHPVLEHMAFEAHAGTILAVTSVGARVIAGKTRGNGFYAFGGGGLWLAPVLGSEEDRGLEDNSSSGFYPYAWTGVGGQVGNKDLQLFGEGGLMFTTDEVSGGGAIPAIAGGIRL